MNDTAASSLVVHALHGLGDSLAIGDLGLSNNGLHLVFTTNALQNNKLRFLAVAVQRRCYTPPLGQAAIPCLNS